MIVFNYKDEEFFIDDDFNVEGGKNKDIFEKDIEIFLMDKTPASGDLVVQYAEHLEKDVGAKVTLVENKKYPLGTLDVSDYEDEED